MILYFSYFNCFHICNIYLKFFLETYLKKLPPDKNKLRHLEEHLEIIYYKLHFIFKS